MAGEIKTDPVKAVHIPDKRNFRDGLFGDVPGSFRVDDPEDDGEQIFWFCCPCGCRRIAPLTVGREFKPDDSPSWSWNGSLEAPTLSPSVHRVGHWHGHLVDGMWESC